MKVITLKPHYNSYGSSYEKARGAEYEVPDDQSSSLIIAGLVEEVDPSPAKDTPKKPAVTSPGTTPS